MLSCEDVHYGYGDTEVLKGMSLHVRAGETVALLGPSGSGKSTLLYCLAGVLAPTRGTVTLDGLVLSDLPDADRTRIRSEKCGFVLQFGRLVQDLTAVENVSIPLRLLSWRRKEAEQKAREMLSDVGVGHLGGRKTGSLSGGEQQRVAVARALVHNPSVLFADEPTGALDTKNGSLVMDCLAGLAATHHSAVILVTHDDTVAAAATRRVNIRDGVHDFDGAIA